MADPILTEPLWDVQVEYRHGNETREVPQRVRAKNEAEARRRAADAASKELGSLGTVVRTTSARRLGAAQ